MYKSRQQLQNSTENKEHTMKRMRYIIPFTWKESYKTMFESLAGSEGWKCRADAHAESRSGPDYKEQDVFEHVLKAFSSNEADICSIGSVWDYKANPNRRIVALTWFAKKTGTAFYIKTDKEAKDPSDTQYTEAADVGAAEAAIVAKTVEDCKHKELLAGKYDVDLTDMGMYLFRNRVGFFWYEISVPEEMGPEQLIEFQYLIKELNRNERSQNSSVLYERDKSENFPEQQENEYISSLKDNQDYKAGFIRDRVTPKNNTGETIRTIRGTLFRYFSLGNWIGEVLGRITQNQNVHLVFFSGSTNIFRGSDESTDDIVPDKANIFSYVTFTEDDLDRKIEDKESYSPEKIEEYRINELREYAFLLSNGYKRSYLVSPYEKNASRFLFANVCIAASQTGCGYFAAPTAENRAFFEGNMKQKVMLDYFLLYILALHQHYSLILYSRRISEELSADPEEYVNSTKMKESLTAIVSEINTFFVKNVNASVSMIAHQNDFYEYVLERLRIAKNIESVKMGLDAIYKLQLRLAEQEEEERKQKQEEEMKSREKRAQKAESSLNFSIALLSLIAIVSAFVDGHEMIGIWQNGRTGLELTGVFQCLYNTLILIITVAFFYVVSRIIKLICSKYKDN